MSDNEPPDPLARLGERLKQAQSSSPDRPASRPDDPGVQEGVGLGLRIGVEFVVAIVVATGLGWAFDRWLGTRPWGTIVLFFLGVGAGMMGVYRAVFGIKTAVGYRRLEAEKQAKKADWDDED